MPNIAVGFVGNRTGIYNDDTGVEGRCRNVRARVKELVLNRSTFGLRGAATKVCDMETLIGHIVHKTIRRGKRKNWREAPGWFQSLNLES
jgi:hypothetical protein